MQKPTFHFLGLLFSAFLLLFVASCGDDEPILPTNTPPSITLAPDAGFVSFSQEVPFATPTFSVRVILDDGDSPLNSLTITQDGSNIPTDSLDFDNGTTQAQNPIAILGDDKNGTSYDIAISPLNPVVNAASTFVFTVSDDEQRRAEASITITFSATPATVTFGTNGLQENQERSVNNASFPLEVVATQGDGAITSIAFYQNDVLMSNEEIIVASNGTALPSNPASLGEVTELTDVFELRPTNATEGPNTFRVDITDALGAVGSQFIVITYIVPEVEEINGVLFNQAGPADTGGLDLDAGAGTGSTNETAEIRDRGIDISLPNASNWRRQISAANDAEMRVVETSQLPDNFSFANVTALNQVIQAFDTGSTPDGDDPDGATVSRPVVVGDMFAVKRGNSYYLIRVDAVNIVEDGNGDNYEISIKK